MRWIVKFLGQRRTSSFKNPPNGPKKNTLKKKKTTSLTWPTTSFPMFWLRFHEWSLYVDRCRLSCPFHGWNAYVCWFLSRFQMDNNMKRPSTGNRLPDVWIGFVERTDQLVIVNSKSCSKNCPFFWGQLFQTIPIYIPICWFIPGIKGIFSSKTTRNRGTKKQSDSSRRRWGSSESKARAWLHSLAVAQALMLELYVTRSSMFISWMEPDGNWLGSCCGNAAGLPNHWPVKKGPDIFRVPASDWERNSVKMSQMRPHPKKDGKT